MKLQKCFVTAESEPQCRAKIAQYMQQCGYQPLADTAGLAFQRGSKNAVLFSSKAKNWLVQAKFYTRFLGGATDQTEITVMLDATTPTMGQYVKQAHKLFEGELTGLINSLGGTIDPASPINIQASLAVDMRLESRIKGGANWFYFIGSLSLINSLIYLLGGAITFVIGLGLTQVIDGFSMGISEGIGGQAGLIVRIIGLVLDFFVASAFFLFGYFSRKKARWAFIAGLIIYALDGILLLFFKDIWGFLFHILAVIGLIGGLQAVNQQKKAVSASPAPIQM